MVESCLKLSPDGEQHRSAEREWRQVWQQGVLRASLGVWNIIWAAAADTATAAVEEAATGASAAGGSTACHASGAEASSSGTASGAAGCSSSSGSTDSSSSSDQQVMWGYLLRLQHLNPRWTAAVTAYRAEVEALPRAPGTGHFIQVVDALVGQQYATAVELIRALAAAVPLPAVCNNPSCERLARVSEAAAASKRCAGCKAADWRRHKHACPRMAAAGEACL
uniref:MYND-type domain-containing protein n=1 Tax=Tetradesmus obliquus TaxID=3088 RepID=A0A383VKR3_TETOB|eukprot:jgi/Sobl393_1/1212/SZX65419.1